MDTNMCGACGAPMASEAKYCSRCGQGLDLAALRAPAQPKWYYNIWFVLFMLFFVLGPFGLPLVWKNPRFSRSVKMVLSIAMIFYAAFLVDLTIRMYRAVMNQMDQINATMSF